MDKLTVNIIGGVVVGIIVAFIVTFLSVSSPVLNLESGCPNSLYIPSSTQIAFSVRNRGDAEGFASVCVESNSLKFVDSGNKTNICYVEQNYAPKSTEILRNFKVNFYYLEDNPTDYLNISISSTCTQKIWGLISKQCQGLNNICRYRKDYTFYTLIS